MLMAPDGTVLGVMHDHSADPLRVFGKPLFSIGVDRLRRGFVPLSRVDRTTISLCLTPHTTRGLLWCCPV
jgi:hypothetical protein